MPELSTGNRVYNWFERRLGFEGPIRSAALHPVPRNTASWWYVFGSAAFTLLILQVVTGVLLALVYVPSAGQAWQSLNILNHDLPLGWFLRAMHGWGSNFMVAIVLIHMAQVFMFGSYKYPRELTWCIGVILLFLTLGMAFTGQVLRFDQDAYWGLGIGASIVARTPFIGKELLHILLGGPIIAGATLTRFFTLHVFIIPGLLLGLALIHIWMVLKLGINEWPMPGRAVRRSTYVAEYQKLAHEKGIPFVPGALWKDMYFSVLVVAAVVVCAIVLGPIGPSGNPDPTIITASPKPDFFFLWIFAVLSYLPASLETPVLLIGPIVAILILIGLPFYANEGEKSWRRRPLAVLILITVAVLWGMFTHLGEVTPWSPKMNAWSGDTIPAHYLTNLTAVQRRGAIIFQYMQCRNCHQLDGIGGERGPALDSVATIMTKDQLIRQVLQGGGNMPAYGKNLKPAEVTAVVSFLETLHPAGQQSAQDMADAVIRAEQKAAGRQTQPYGALSSPAPAAVTTSPATALTPARTAPAAAKKPAANPAAAAPAKKPASAPPATHGPASGAAGTVTQAAPGGV